MTKGAVKQTDAGLSKLGAKTMASRVKAFWKKQGWAVAVTLHKLDTHDDPDLGDAGAVWCLKTDMVNGMPAGMAKALALKAKMAKCATVGATTH